MENRDIRQHGIFCKCRFQTHFKGADLLWQEALFRFIQSEFGTNQIHTWIETTAFNRAAPAHGDVPDALVRAVLAGSSGLVHMSGAEGQSLAVLEALSAGAPVVLSRLPSHVELQARYPGHVIVVDDVDAVPAAVGQVADRQPGPAAVPTWDDIAAELIALYRAVLPA